MYDEEKQHRSMTSLKTDTANYGPYDTGCFDANRCKRMKLLYVKEWNELCLSVSFSTVLEGVFFQIVNGR